MCDLKLQPRQQSCEGCSVQHQVQIYLFITNQMCYAVAYVLNITDNLNKMFYLIQVAYLYIIIF